MAARRQKGPKASTFREKRQIPQLKSEHKIKQPNSYSLSRQLKVSVRDDKQMYTLYLMVGPSYESRSNP